MKPRNFLQYTRHHAMVAVMLGAALLAACGGGNETSTTEPVVDTSTPTPDTTSPSINSAAAEAEAVVQTSQVTLAGSASDDTALKSVVLELRGSTTTVALVGGAFTTTLALEPGRNAYALIATDEAGNSTRVESAMYFGRQLAAGNSHSGAIINGQLHTWGRNNYGQTGLGFTSTLADNPDIHPVAPARVSTTTTFVSLAFNQNQSVALDASGKLWSWGDDSYGQLGRGDSGRASCGSGSNNCRLDMAEVSGLEQVLAVSTGYSHVLALRSDGTVWGFGLNDLGQLGDGSTVNRSTPVQVLWDPADAATVGRIIQVSASSKSSYALDDKGQLWAWGRNQYANLGQGAVSASTAAQSTPLRVPMPEGVRIVSVANGRDHVLALTSEGKVYAWGLNASSQVGYYGYIHKGTATAWPSTVLSPTRLPAMETSPAVAVYANGNTSYVRRADGKLYPWGMYGQTEGTGTVYANLDEPEDRLPMLTTMMDLAVGALHQVALRADGQVFTWGWSFEGSLGGGATTIDTWMYNTPLNPQFP